MADVRFLPSPTGIALTSSADISDLAELLDRCAAHQSENSARFKAAAGILRASRIGAPKRIDTEAEAAGIAEVIDLNAIGKARSIAAAARMVARTISGGGSSVDRVADRLARGAYARLKEKLYVPNT